MGQHKSMKHSGCIRGSKAKSRRGRGWPWLAKFRGLSKQGLEQAARTYGFLRSLNRTGTPIHGLVDCIAVNVFR